MVSYFYILRRSKTAYRKENTTSFSFAGLFFSVYLFPSCLYISEMGNKKGGKEKNFFIFSFPTCSVSYFMKYCRFPKSSLYAWPDNLPLLPQALFSNPFLSPCTSLSPSHKIPDIFQTYNHSYSVSVFLPEVP